MEVLRYFMTVALLIIILCTNTNETNAVDSGFSTEELPKDDRSTFLSNVTISLLEEEPPKKSILCFDVNEEGMIAVGQSDGNGKKKICIYSSDGVFQYGYAIHCRQDIGAEWDGDCINIYFVRSSVITKVDPEGNILDVEQVQETIENNSYRNFILHSNKRTIGDTVYFVRNKMGILNFFASTYSQVVIKNSSTEERIVYDVNAAQLRNQIIILVGVVLFVALAVHGVIRAFKTQCITDDLGAR